MSVSEGQDNKFSVLRWVARIWSIPIIGLIVNEILFPSDKYFVNDGWLAWATRILLFLSVFGLLIAWWNELMGGLASIGLLILFFLFYWFDKGEFAPGWMMYLGLIALPAALFILYDYVARKQPREIL